MVKIKENCFIRDIFSKRNALDFGLVRQKTCQRQTIINKNNKQTTKQCLKYSLLKWNVFDFQTFICCLLIWLYICSQWLWVWYDISVDIVATLLPELLGLSIIQSILKSFLISWTHRMLTNRLCNILFVFMIPPIFSILTQIVIKI